MSRAVNERTQQRAMGEFYDNIKVENLHKIKICKTFVRVIYPVFCVIFWDSLLDDWSGALLSITLTHFIENYS